MRAAMAFRAGVAIFAASLVLGGCATVPPAEAGPTQSNPQRVRLPVTPTSTSEDLPPWSSTPGKVSDSGTRSGATGQVLNAPASDMYVVTEGDTPSDIALRFDVGLEQLLDENGDRLGASPTIYPGDRIQFGIPLTGKNYDCFFGLISSGGKGQSCYS